MKAEVWLDRPESLKNYSFIYLGEKPLRLLSARPQKQFMLLKLEGVEDMNAAMALKGREFSIDREEAQLPEGAYFLQDLLGAEVRDEEGRRIGELTEILEKPASNVYVVQRDNGEETLIPAIDPFVLSTDAVQGLITVHLLPGM